MRLLLAFILFGLKPPKVVLFSISFIAFDTNVKSIFVNLWLFKFFNSSFSSSLFKNPYKVSLLALIVDLGMTKIIISTSFFLYMLIV